PRNLVPALPRRGGDITVELHCIHINLQLSGAGEGNRTLVTWLGTRSSAIELHPPGPLKDGRTAPEGTTRRSSRVSVQTYLAIGYHMEVSPLSRRGNRCIPYPAHYRPAFAFSMIIYLDGPQLVS